MDDFDRHFARIERMQRWVLPLAIVAVLLKLGVIGFLLWLAYQFVMRL